MHVYKKKKRILGKSYDICSLSIQSILDKKSMGKGITRSMEWKKSWYLSLEGLWEYNSCSCPRREKRKTWWQKWEIHLHRLWFKFKRVQVVQPKQKEDSSELRCGVRRRRTMGLWDSWKGMQLFPPLEEENTPQHVQQELPHQHQPLMKILCHLLRVKGLCHVQEPSKIFMMELRDRVYILWGFITFHSWAD